MSRICCLLLCYSALLLKTVCTELPFQEPGVISRKSGQLVSYGESLQQVTFFEKHLKCSAGSQGGLRGRRKYSEGNYKSVNKY